MAPEAVAFADVLRRHRTAAGLTREELAEPAGLSPCGLLFLERGGRHLYRYTVRRLGQAWGLTAPQLDLLAAAARAGRMPALAMNSLSASALRRPRSRPLLP